MHAIEFTAELNELPTLHIPDDVAAKLPKSGSARIIILTADDSDDRGWRAASYEQFLRDDAPEDSVYDKYG